MQDGQMMEMLERDPERGMVQILKQYTGLVWKVTSLYLRNPEDIKEAVNDTFAEFYLHRERFDSEQSELSLWLASIARHRAISHYRREHRHQHAELSDEIALEEDPLTQVEIREDLKRLMSNLRPDELEIIRMKYYGGMTVREIAESLEIPYETVKKRHQRSMRKLYYLLLLLVVLALTACTYGVLRYQGIIGPWPFFIQQHPKPEVDPIGEDDKTGSDDRKHDDRQADRTPAESSLLEMEQTIASEQQAYLEREEKEKASAKAPEIQLYPTHGINYDSATPVYTLQKQAIAEDEDKMLVVNRAEYSNRNLTVEIMAYLKNEETARVMSFEPLYEELSIQGQYIEQNDNLRYIITAETGSETEQTFSHWYNIELRHTDLDIPIIEDEKIVMSFSLRGLAVDFILGETLEKASEEYAYQYEEHGGLLALAKREEENCQINIYPKNEKDYMIMPGLIRGLYGEDYGGNVVLRSAASNPQTDAGAGGEKIGQCYRYRPRGPETYFRWDFGNVKSGDYVLQIPYLMMQRAYGDLEISVDLETCSWEQSDYPFPGGVVHIEDCTEIPIDTPGLELERFYEIGIEDAVKAWRVRVRYEMDDDQLEMIQPCMNVQMDETDNGGMIIDNVLWAYTNMYEIVVDSQQGVWDFLIVATPDNLDIKNCRLVPDVYTHCQYVVNWKKEFNLNIHIE